MHITKVGIIGIGTMGRQLCQLFAMNGFRVAVVDASAQIAGEGVNVVVKSLERLVEKGKIAPGKMSEAASNIRITNLDGLKDEDLIVECISEVLELKQRIFMDLDPVAREDAIFATNTSSFSVREVFDPILDRRLALGLHFFNPVWALPLVEFVTPRSLPDEIRESIREFLARNGRQVVEIADSPGFVVNRILFGMIAEACTLASEGTASPRGIDVAMKTGANLPMGPFELVDLIGVDTSREILTSLGERLDDDSYRRAAEYVRPLIEKGNLGRKAGRGFYEYATR